MPYVRRNGTRLVYEVQYTRNEYLSVLFGNNITEIEAFIIHSIKLCLNPKFYSAYASMPNDGAITNFETKTGKNIDRVKFTSLLEFFNGHNPLLTINKARANNVITRDIKYLSAARYLRNMERMIRLKDEYKANRINILMEDLLDYKKTKTSKLNYDKHTLMMFSKYIKDLYLPDRSSYVKK
jgi:hypothetical protein